MEHEQFELIPVSMGELIGVMTAVALGKVLEDVGNGTEMLERISVYMKNHPDIADQYGYNIKELRRATVNMYTTQIHMVERILREIGRDELRPELREAGEELNARGRQLGARMRTCRALFIERMDA